ncbi:uncharacterized protein Stacl isoform X5 [Procambarus clarkii]|uniref:uncharacterized protein Stacl isoform X5 n=1 Tax=Procambarus clarkii TaxID=6728 RepID=UPI003743D436
MYVIFPLDDLLDLNSAKGSKRETSSSSAQQSHKRHTVQVLPPSQPNQQLPSQLQPPLNQLLPNPQKPTPPQQKLQQQQQQQQQQLKLQKTTSQKTPSKASTSSQPSPLSPQLPSSVPSSSSSSHSSSLKQPPRAQHRPHQHADILPKQRQPSSSTETSSVSSTGAKAKVLLSPPSSGVKYVANRSSWAGSPTGPPRESSVTRSNSFKARDDLNVDGSSQEIATAINQKFNSLRVKDHRSRDNSQDSRDSGNTSGSQSFRSHIVKSESFRSYLSSGGVQRPQSIADIAKSQQLVAESVKPQQAPVAESAKSQQVSIGESVKTQQEYLPQSSRRPPAQRHPSGSSRHSSGSQRASDQSLFPGSGPSAAGGATAAGRGAGANVKSQAGLRGLQKSVMASEISFRDLTHPSANETLKAQNSVTFKLVKTVSDFTAQLSRIHEQHAEEIQRLVETFRKKNSELRNERPPCPNQMFQAWETLLQEVEVDSQIHSDVAGTLNRQVSRPLIEKTFYRKIQSRKVFTHRESFDTILAKTEDMLKKCRRDYSEAYQSHCRSQNNASLANYFDAHNAYIQQLHATNGMLQEYHNTTLPALLEELETVYLDVSSIVADCILQGADIVAAKALEQSRRYDSLCNICRSADGRTDMASLVRSLEAPTGQPVRPPHYRYSPPQPAPPLEAPNGEPLPQEPPPPVPLRNELILDRLAALSSRNRYEALRKEAGDLERQIAQLLEAQDTLVRIQQRSIESSVFNKANELQEDISIKRFDLRVAQVHLSAVRAQKELFASKDGGGAEGRERKMSNSSGGSMKTKWMKAFKSLKTSEPASSNLPPTSPAKRYTFSSTVLSVMAHRKNAREKEKEAAAMFDTAHIFQEYTYKKITACDVCHQILRGHSRQGLKCRMCKTNVHVECQEQVGKCQPKSRLLRRQRSTSEIESKQLEGGEDDTDPSVNFTSLIASQPSRRGAEPPSPSATTEIQIDKTDKTEEVDLIYQVLKQAGDLGGRRSTHGSVERDLGREMSREMGREVGRDLGGSAASSGSGSATSLHRRFPRPTNTGSTLTVNPVPVASSSGKSAAAAVAAADAGAGVVVKDGVSAASMRRRMFGKKKSQSEGTEPPIRHAPISPRRQKLNLRMKSFSLDSPESTEHVHRRRQGGSAHVSHASSHSQSPSSPVHNRRLLTARNMRMSSVDLPDENEKSLSSASTSPCPSPVSKKPHRLLPTNLYVVLYNFTSRHPDELDLRAGYKVTVTDTSDPDWWQGKCLGRTGYFPSKYVTRLNGGEKPLQVTHNLQVTDGDNGIKLLRDQIVIQIGEEVEGMVMIRNGDNQQGVCPLKYLQEA